MRKVQNKKAVRSLSDKSFRASRTRNIIAVVAIALTAMLFSTLFTIGLGAVEIFQRETMRQAGSDSHATVKDVTREQYETLKDHPLIKESAACEPLADEVMNPEFLKRRVEFWYVPEYHYPHRFLELKEGRAPEAADEIAVDEVTMSLLGLPEETGQEITLTLKLGQEESETVERTFTVSGIFESDTTLDVGFAVASEAYLSAYEQELSKYAADSGALTGHIYMEINFGSSLGIESKTERVITESGYSVTEGDPDFLSSNTNWAYLSEGMSGDYTTIAALAAGLLLILLTGYLIIYNVFRISVIRDIRYYGLLKTIGTTGRQIRRIVRRQAWKLAAAGIPFGLFFGYLIGKGIVPLVVVRTAYESAEADFSANPLIFIGAALFSLATVLISTRKPAKIAGKVSPVEALRYTEGGGERRKAQRNQKRSTDGGKLWRMALSNLGRSKGRTAVVILSMSLAVVLLNSVFTLAGSFSMEKYLSKFVLSDFLIGSAQYFNNSYMGFESDLPEESLSESFVEACEAQDGFVRGGRIYMSGEITLVPESYTPTENVLVDENGDFYWMWGSEKVPYNKDQNGNYYTTVYGLEDYPLEQIEVYEGETDLDVIREKLSTGEYVLASVSTDDSEVVEEDEIQYRAGDTVTLMGTDGTAYDVTILSLIKEDYYGLTNRMGSNFSFYMAADVFTEIASRDYLMSYAFEAEDEKEAQIEAELQEYTTTVEPLMHYESRLEWMDDFQGMKDLVFLIGGVLTVVIGTIGVLNFINSTLTSVVTRRREFAMMEAIGMTKRQLVRMLILEGIYYAGLTSAVSLGAGCILSLTAVRGLVGSMWFMEYHFVIWPMLAVLPVLFIMGAAVPYAAYLPQRKESVVSIISREAV